MEMHAPFHLLAHFNLHSRILGFVIAKLPFSTFCFCLKVLII